VDYEDASLPRASDRGDGVPGKTCAGSGRRGGWSRGYFVSERKVWERLIEPPGRALMGPWRKATTPRADWFADKGREKEGRRPKSGEKTEATA